MQDFQSYDHFPYTYCSGNLIVPVCEECQQCTACQMRDSGMNPTLYHRFVGIASSLKEAAKDGVKVMSDYQKQRSAKQENKKNNSDRPERNVLSAVRKYYHEVKQDFDKYSPNIESLNALQFKGNSAGTEAFDSITAALKDVNTIIEFYELAIQSRTTTRDVSMDSEDLKQLLTQFGNAESNHTTSFVTVMQNIVAEIKPIKDFLKDKFVGYDPFYRYQYSYDRYNGIVMEDDGSVKNFLLQKEIPTKMPGSIERLLGSIGKQEDIRTFDFKRAQREILSYLSMKNVPEKEIKDIAKSIEEKFGNLGDLSQHNDQIMSDKEREESHIQKANIVPHALPPFDKRFAFDHGQHVVMNPPHGYSQAGHPWQDGVGHTVPRGLPLNYPGIGIQ